jgi:hypothetical protein
VSPSGDNGRRRTDLHKLIAVLIGPDVKQFKGVPMREITFVLRVTVCEKSVRAPGTKRSNRVIDPKYMVFHLSVATLPLAGMRTRLLVNV